MMIDENKVVESISESYDTLKTSLLQKNLAAEKGGQTRNPEPIVQTA